MCYGIFHALMNVFSVLQVDPLSKVHLSALVSFFISVLSSPFGCFHLLEVLSLITASVLLCGPPAAALTLSQLWSRITKRKSHSSNFHKVCLALGRLALLLLSFPVRLSSFSSETDL